MKNDIICTASINSLGNTFLDWTIQYLSGSVYHLHANRLLNVQRSLLTDNPLQFQSTKVGNAHIHCKTHPHGLSEIQQVIAKIKSTKKVDELVTIYSCPLNFVETANKKFKKNIHSDFFKNKENLKMLLEYIATDFGKIFEYCNSESMPLIYVEDTMWNFLYKPRYNVTFDSQGKLYQPDNFQEIVYNALDWGFPNAKEKFDNHIWDTREYIALHLRPSDNTMFKFNFKLPHYFIEANSLWIDGEHTIEHVMDWLNLGIVKDRYTNWLPVYKKWQQMHLARLRLPQNIEFICKAIINGWDHSLKQYNLDLFDEAFIQHKLIYKYNLTLKNWGLETFPDNTNKLTGLLEESFYENLETLYK